jgi:3-oxoacyl-[acyl-carrier protein] reductase
MDLGLKDKVALVTGAGSQKGFGKGIALYLAKEGCNIIATDINLDGAQQTAAEVEALGRQAMAIKADVTNRTEVGDMVKAGLDKFGKIDVLVNNAGASSQLKPVIEMSKEDLDFNIKVNLYGQINVAQAVLPSMIARHYGRIINFSGGQGVPNISIYGAAKAGVEAFTHSLALEVAPYGVIVNGVFPGLGLTGLTDKAPPEFIQMFIQNSALKRTCTPEDMGAVVAFLASDVCSYMVGQIIKVHTE